MGEPILDPGRQAGMCVHDGSEWRKAKGDADGHAQVDILSSTLPTGAATETTLSSILTELKKPGVSGGKHFHAAQAPTGWVEVWRYTVPAGKRAIINFAHVRVAPTTGSEQACSVIRVGVAGGTVSVFLLQARSRTDLPVNYFQALQIELRESDYIAASVYNGDTVSRVITATCTYFEQSA